MTHTETALRHLEASRAFRIQLADEYSFQPVNKTAVADLHEQIRFGQKQAEVLALIGIADELKQIREAVSDDFETTVISALKVVKEPE